MTKDMINKRMKIIADLQVELKKVRALYEESLENDSLYQEVVEELTKIKEENNVKKERVLANTSYKALSDQIKELQREIKENKEALSQDLVDYYRESGITEIEDYEGNIKRMKFSVRLVN